MELSLFSLIWAMDFLNVSKTMPRRVGHFVDGETNESTPEGRQCKLGVGKGHVKGSSISAAGEHFSL